MTIDNPFRHIPEGLDPDEEAFLAKFGGLEKSSNTAIQAPKIEEEEEIPAEVAVSLGATQEQKEAFLNELVDIAPGFKIPRKEYEAVVELFKRANEDLPEREKILIENEVGNEKSGTRIQVKEGHVIYLDLSGTPIQSLDGIMLPQELKLLHLSGTPIQSLDGVILPGRLQILELSGTPIQSLDGVILPEGLQKLYLSYCRQFRSLDGIKLPEGLKELQLSGTSIQYLDGVVLPEGLQNINLWDAQIKSLSGVILPEKLQVLKLVRTPIQSLDGVKLPEGMQKMHLNGTPLSKNTQKMAELKTKYPSIKFTY